MQRQRRQAEMSRRVISARLLSGELLGCRLRVNRVGLKMRRSLRFFPYEQTSAAPVGMSQKCPDQTSAWEDMTLKLWYVRREKTSTTLYHEAALEEMDRR